MCRWVIDHVIISATLLPVMFQTGGVGIKGGMGNEEMGMRNGNEEWKWRNGNE